MKTVENTEIVSEIVRNWRHAGETHAFVPTMGFLHEGHLSLVDLAQRAADRVSVSIFVNPAQFNDPKDLEKYPRSLQCDLTLLRHRGVDLVFCPSTEEFYPRDFQSWVSVEALTKRWEGAGRPGHFRGVTTVVSMLFHALQPDFAVFGEKDFQQLRVIEQMVADLKFPIEIVRGTLIREEDGLAMSSRNSRLSFESRQKALGISRGLLNAQKAYQRGERRAEALCQAVQRELQHLPGVAVQYLACVQEDTLEAVEDVPDGVPCRVLTTVVVDGIRLLDNMVLNP